MTPDNDYGGGLVGLLAFVVISISGFWLGLVSAVWKWFLEPQIKQLRADRAADNERCEEQLRRQGDRIIQLEAMLMMHGPQELRQAIQLSLSEKELEIRGLMPGSRARGTRP